jgi:predicted transcriptional regulator YheO
MPKTAIDKILLRELKTVAQGLGQTFSPFCEVVVHDLTNPQNSILCIENNLSGRKVGDPATELGLARVKDPGYPAIVANYANQFADGRKAKSTSIGIRDGSGKYVAALCLNVDLTLFDSFQAMMSKFANLSEKQIHETLGTSHADVLRKTIDEFAAMRATTPRALQPADRRRLLKELKSAGHLDIRHGAEIAAAHMGVSRATVYSDSR